MDGNAEGDITDTWGRIARALAVPETRDRAAWEQRFYDALEGFKFLPGGRIQAGAGTARRVTLFNCFVMGRVEDSIDGIFTALKEGALTMQQGGGVGYDFSTLRPGGAPARSVGSIASGPVSFMRNWDTMCATLLSTGTRRGAMMATLRCDHPDIERFVDAKRDRHALRHFNLSVQVTDAFMQAVRQDDSWPLLFPAEDLNNRDAGDDEIVMREWPGKSVPVACVVLRRIPARDLWARIMRATYDYAEPGVLFVDRINALNNLWYRERISATNPCGEIPLPPYGACDLGSINLTCFVNEAFSERAHFDMAGMQQVVATATRMLDNVIDVSQFPLDAQREQARSSRRIGLGLTGLADALIMQGIEYGTDAATEFAASVMGAICHSAYGTSVQLAQEKGAFPLLEKSEYLRGEFIRALPAEIRDGISMHGIRNSHLTAIAPTGTISLLANNVSSGLEPVFDYAYTRRVLSADGGFVSYELTDYAVQQWRAVHGKDGSLPAALVDARSLDPVQHLRMQAALQPFVDNAISKTINVPQEFAFSEFRSLYEQAFEMGLKGCTTFRSNPVTGDVLHTDADDATATFCCTMEREGD